MFRQKKYSRNRYYRKRKQHERQIFSPFWVSIAIISIPVLLILIELLARLVTNFTDQSQVLATYDGLSSLERAYGLNFVTQNQAPIQGLSQGGNLQVERSLGLSYRFIDSQQNQFLQINEQGFRDHEPVPLAKPKDELRVVLLGGSTAFGYWNQSNSETIATYLEARLQERIAQQKTFSGEVSARCLAYLLDRASQSPNFETEIATGKLSSDQCRCSWLYLW